LLHAFVSVVALLDGSADASFKMNDVMQQIMALDLQPNGALTRKTSVLSNNPSTILSDTYESSK
jgi:hypothetical protein